MRKFAYILLSSLCLLLGSFIGANAAIGDELIINESVNKEKIELIENYIITHKKKIELFAKKYEISNNPTLNSSINDFSDMIIILRKLKTNTIEQKDIDRAVKIIVDSLRKINLDLKPLLKEKKLEFEKKLLKKSQLYSKLGKKVGDQLDKLIKNTVDNLNKRTLSNTQKRAIIESLINLEKESKKLKNFNNIPFNNQNEMKNGFLRIIKNIKRELLDIKSVLTSK